MAKHAKIKVEINGRGAAALLHDDGVRRELERRMRRVYEAALSSAPVDQKPDGIHYRDSITLETGGGRSRVRAQVKAYSPYARKVEANHGTLARAFDAAGGA